MASYGRLPLSFEPNVGQTDPAVRFLSRNGQFTVFLTSSEVVFAIAETRGTDKEPKGRDRLTGSVIRMQLLGASTETEVVGEELSPGKKNYLLGRDPAKWHVGVPLYSQARYREIYPGVDLRFRGGSQQLEFDFIVHPGANPRYIALAFQGAADVRPNKTGDLVLPTAKGELHLVKPIAYQEADDGTQQPVDAKFVLGPNHAVGFALGEYDSQRKLVIDPMVTYATYLGGSLQDEGLGIALDSSQNVYVTGATASVDFPIANQFQFNLTGSVDAFITALDPTGSTLLFSTYYGGQTQAPGEVTVGRGIAVDSTNGLIFITGYTDSPSLQNYGSQFYAGGWDAFLAVLTIDGQRLPAAAYLGGTADDIGTAVTFDTHDNAWIVGQTFSGDFPVVSPLSVPNGSVINLGQGTGPSDSFVAEIAPSSTVNFATYYGGGQQDFATSVAISNQTTSTYDVYFAGGTNSPDFFVTPNAIQQTCGNGPAQGNSCDGGQDDGFVAAITYDQNSSAYVTIQSTFLGGSGQDDVYGIALDASENVYITGRTNSPGPGSQPFPTAGGPLQSSLKGKNNAFFTQFNPLTNVLLYSTYFGGSGSDAGLGIAVDPGNNVYLTGRTNSPNFPIASPTQGTKGGSQDAFVSALVPSNGSFLLGFSTYLGGSGDENLVGGGIAVDSAQNAYVTGDTNSSDFPVTSGVLQPTFNGTGTCTITTEVPPGTITAPCEDAFIAKILTQNNPTLTVNLTGNGIATVTSTPPGINCSNPPNSCSAGFPFGTQVTLTAPFVANTTFNGWSGAGCSGTGSCAVTMTADQQVGADFSAIQTPPETLTVTLAGTGSGKVVSVPPGIYCLGSNTGCDPANFLQNTVVTLTATTPDPNSTFAGWSGACTNATGPCVVTMTSAVNVIATFTANALPVLTVGGTGSGLVTSSPRGINCSSPNTCSQAFPQGTTVTLSAVAVSGSTFTGWGGACSGTGSCVLTMNSDQTVTATFTLIPVARLSINIQGTGSGTVSSNPVGIACPGTCTDTFPVGTTITVTATPANGSLFLSWGGDANSQGCSINPVCTITARQPGVLVFSATFSLPTPQNLVSVSFTGTGSGTVVSTPTGISCPGTCSALFDTGLTVTLTATPGNSSVFNGWGQGCSGTAQTCQLTVTQNGTVTADFSQVNPTLAVQINNTGIGSGTVTSSDLTINCPGSCTATYPPGTSISLTATPGAGSTFTGWSGGLNSFNCFNNPVCQFTIGQNSIQTTAGFDQPPPVPPPFDLTVSPSTTLSLQTGGSTATGVSLLSVNGFTDTVSLMCSVQPASANAPTCLLSPASVSLGANQAASSTLTINAFTTTAFKRTPIDRNRTPRLYAFALPLTVCLFFGSASWSRRLRRRNRLSVLFGLLLAVTMLSLHIGCGGGGSSQSNGSTNNSAPGQYTVTVVATGTTAQVQQTTVVTVTVH